MEGRAIARPNWHEVSVPQIDLYALQWRAGQLPGQTGHRIGAAQLAELPSMEGRAIARPNS